jgi:hypothetical protein
MDVQPMEKILELKDFYPEIKMQLKQQGKRKNLNHKKTKFHIPLTIQTQPLCVIT